MHVSTHPIVYPPICTRIHPSAHQYVQQAVILSEPCVPQCSWIRGPSGLCPHSGYAAALLPAIRLAVSAVPPTSTNCSHVCHHPVLLSSRDQDLQLCTP
eukprot:300571-Chlamydomonas_euryale.AAC.17